jgi:multicomponent Na+:H+ antiporter subunit B
MQIFDFILWLLLLAAAVWLLRSRSLVNNIIILGAFSLLAAALMLRLSAPDVAITEAAIGAAITTIFFLAGLKIIGKSEEEATKHHKTSAKIVLGSLLLVLFTVVSTIPNFGSSSSPANKHVGAFYLEQTMADTGVPNAVTSVLASYRGYDTLGETYVIFTAGIAILLIMPSLKKKKKVQK